MSWEEEAGGRPGCWGEGGQWLRTKGVRAMDGATWVEAVGLYALPTQRNWDRHKA